MNIEDAKSELQSEREAYWAHLTDPMRRRVQNRINKYVSRWNTSFYLDTAEDFHILACEIQDMRKGRGKRRVGRPRKPDNRGTSQRLADQRCKPDADKLEEDTLFGSGVDFGFDQLDTALPSEEDVNISTETSTSHPSVASSGGEFTHNLSNEIYSPPDSISSNIFDFCNSQTLSQYSNISSLTDETWCHSDDMSDPAMSGMLSGANIAGSLQQDICDGISMNFDWQGDPPSFNGPHDVVGNGEHWNGSNNLVPESHGPFIQPVMHDPVKSTSRGIDGSIGLLSWLPSPNTDGNEVQQAKRFDEVHLSMLMTELKSQLHKGRKDTICSPIPTGNKEAGARQEDSGPGKRYGAEVEMRVAYLWDALKSCSIPSLT